MSTAQFEKILTGVDVENRCLAVLKKWSQTYVAEVERQHSVPAGTLPPIRAWVNSTDLDKWPEDQLPAVVLVSVGTAEPPIKDGRGRYRARFQMALFTIVSARTQAETHALADLYGAAHRALLLQRPSLEGFSRGIAWQEETYDDLDYDDTRSLGAMRFVFTVEVPNVTTTYAGPVTPAEPLADELAPWPPYATVDEVSVELKKEEA